MDAQIKNLVQGINISNLDIVFLIISISIYVAGAGVLFYYFYKKNNLRLMQLASGFGILFVLTEVLKNLLLRARPDLSDNLSFPSNHAAFAFFLAVFLPAKREYKILLWIWAILVAFSRLWLNKHWFSDVIAGAVIGIAVAFLVKNKKIEKNLEKIKLI